MKFLKIFDVKYTCRENASYFEDIKIPLRFAKKNLKSPVDFHMRKYLYLLS